MAKTVARRTSTEASLDFGFFQYLWQFFRENRGTIRSYYKDLSKKYLDYNNPERNAKAFLRQPQYDALEIYVFLKEFLDNARVEEIFQQWFEKAGRFAGRGEGGIVGNVRQGDIFDAMTQEQYRNVFSLMRRNARTYPNYIFALTMGTGKTILMATCIFYEFLLANKFPKDRRYCHNALVFAPDKTVLQSLREIESFDKSSVIPQEYADLFETRLKFHYLEEAGTSLNTLDGSMFNIVVSNTQKIILKRNRAEKKAADLLFAPSPPVFTSGSVYDAAADLYAFDQPEEDAELTLNQRFEKLCRLRQLGIYVDEAHHAFGKTLAKDMGIGAKPEDTSLRTTIDMLAGSLERAGTHVVACYNYTGTPYVGRDVLPEVVYAYGLREAIDKGYLKKVKLHGYSNTRNDEFVNFAVKDFLEQTAGLRPEGMAPKLAFFAATVEELTEELKPAVEAALITHGIDTSSILVNVGDSKLTSNDDIREFNRLDTPESEKRFILLVNKGREGWNCRSLFGVGLYREPKSKIFVLQASMRCLRAIGGGQHTGQVYLAEQNLAILNDELQANFRISTEEVQQIAADKVTLQVHVMKTEKIKLKRVRRSFDIREKVLTPGAVLGLSQDDKQAWLELTKGYHIIETTQEGFDPTSAASSRDTRTTDLSDQRQKVTFSALTLVAEVARYLNRSPIEMEAILEQTHEGLPAVLRAVNTFNELLYDVVIPRLFSELYDLDERVETEEHEVELIKLPPPERAYYEVSADKYKIARMSDATVEEQAKSFHLDAYAFDSNPEQTLFWDLLREKRVTKLYFTGMLTHGQSEFYFQYIDPESHTVRSYYPDFLFQRDDGSYVIVEVKGDNMIDDPIVRAKKDFAHQVAVASGMTYEVIKGSLAQAREYRYLI